eukprot:12927687-Prorocentrum_lima.AAC.1
MLIPWVAPLREKSDAPREILITIDFIPGLGPLRGTFGTQLVRLQSDNGGRCIHEPLIEGCNKRGVCMAQIPPYQPRSNGLIERTVGIVKEQMRRVLHAAVLLAICSY